MVSEKYTTVRHKPNDGNKYEFDHNHTLPVNYNRYYVVLRNKPVEDVFPCSSPVVCRLATDGEKLFWAFRPEFPGKPWHAEIRDGDKWLGLPGTW
jgi:hypothetical protein